MSALKRICSALACAIVLACTIVFAQSAWVSQSAVANDIESIDITAQLQPDGSMVITDRRIFNAEEGTEHYIALGDLGPSEVTGFSVSEAGVPLQDVGAWDVDASFAQKSGKFGVVETNDGMELCFGLGSYGRKDFTITYRVSNSVRKLKDGYQALYWTFINPDMDPIDVVNVRVTDKRGFVVDPSIAQSDARSQRENEGAQGSLPTGAIPTRMWGYGFDGQTTIGSTALEMNGGRDFRTSDYMTMLAIFPAGTFQTAATYPYTSEGIEELAKEGSAWEVKNGKASGASFGSAWRDLYWRVAPILVDLVAAVILLYVYYVILRGVVESIRDAMRGQKAPSALARVKPTVEGYYREIPLGGPFYPIVSLLDTEAPQWMSAIFLEWIKDGHLKPIKYEAGWLFKHEDDGFVINQPGPKTFCSDNHQTLWNYLMGAAGENGILENKELQAYFERSEYRFSNWHSHMLWDSNKFLLDNGYIFIATKKYLGVINRKRYELTPTGQELVNQIAGFKRYLSDFSLLNEREASNVMLWDELMVWAAALGIAEKVEEQFAILDPGYSERSVYRGGVITISRDFGDSARRGYSAAHRSSSSSSSRGGGGRSSRGGGSRSSGGSRGGGTR